MLRITPQEIGIHTDKVMLSPPYPVTGTLHEDHEINLVVEGSCRYRCDTQLIHLSANQIFAVPSGVSHHIEVTGPVTLWVMHLHPQVINRMLVSASLRASPDAKRLLTFPKAPRVSSDIRQFHVIQELLEHHQMESSHLDLLRPYTMAATAFLLAANFLRVVHGADRPIHDEPLNQRLLHVRAWIDRHFTEQITIDVLAEQANLCPAYFCVVFRKLFGEPPLKYLTRLRLNRASALLSDTDLPVMTIAHSSGFNSPANFHRMFRQRFGLSPNALRTQDGLPADR